MPDTSLQISYTLANIENAVHQLWQYAHQYRVWLLHGDMGAGKTTLVHALCDYLGVTDPVSSPTFALLNEYHFRDKNDDSDQLIFHMDWYRLRDAEEALNAGMDDALHHKTAYSFIEWPEKAPELIPASYANISIETINQQERLLICELRNKLTK